MEAGYATDASKTNNSSACANDCSSNGGTTPGGSSNGGTAIPGGSSNGGTVAPGGSSNGGTTEPANSISSLLKPRANAPTRVASSLKLTVRMGQQIHFLDSQRFYTYDIDKDAFLAASGNENLLSEVFKNDVNAPQDFSPLKYSFNYGDFAILCTSSRWFALHTKQGRFYSFNELGFADNLLSTVWKNDANAPKPAEILTAFTYSPDPKYVVFMTATKYFMFNQNTGKFENNNTLASAWGSDPKAPSNISQIRLSFVIGNSLFLFDQTKYYQFDLSSGKFIHP